MECGYLCYWRDSELILVNFCSFKVKIMSSPMTRSFRSLLLSPCPVSSLDCLQCVLVCILSESVVVWISNYLNTYKGHQRAN